MRSVSFLAFILLVGCASQTEKDAVLEEVRAEVEAEDAELAATNTSLQKLSKILDAEGYQGVGLQYETEKTLDKLADIFADPTTQKRKIKLVYTGLKLLYDSRYQSLTIPGDVSKVAVLEYIKKSVPAK